MRLPLLEVQAPYNMASPRCAFERVHTVFHQPGPTIFEGEVYESTTVVQHRKGRWQSAEPRSPHPSSELSRPGVARSGCHSTSALSLSASSHAQRHQALSI